MNISDKSIKRFQKIYKTNFGEEISFAEARERGGDLVRLFEIICSPNIQDDTNKQKSPIKL